MAWKVQRTESFDKWWGKERVHDSNYKGHERSLQDFRNINMPHNVQTSIFKNTSYECWVSRLPDKARNKGKQGGFRVVFILDLEEETLLLQGIFRREHLGFKNQSGKFDDAYEELIKELAQKFIATDVVSI